MEKQRKSSGIGSTIAPPRFIAFLLVLAAAVGLAIDHMPPGHALMAGFDIAAVLFLLSLAPLLGNRSADRMREAARHNDANRALLLIVTSVVIAAILVAVGVELRSAKQPDTAATALIIGTLALAWLFSNMVYALHYAHLYYLGDSDDGGDQGGLAVPGTDEPVYWDFIYFSFTLGMTFQTSDVDMPGRHMRRVAIFHCLAAFVFNIGVLAFTINVLGS
ncbi:DUF1345 domain-containing protein [Sphingomonas flavalba]|uniref:DUF1345 domain-containing protein n=1 Tax=Sphingomonas flavalba TaxID=2559804 RepID=UPI00109DFE88|nr:DUF1345 domain-containing protein [Sphingomonas flavalba]